MTSNFAPIVNESIRSDIHNQTRDLSRQQEHVYDQERSKPWEEYQELVHNTRLLS